MATVAAIFDDSVALEHAVSALNDAGLGGDIVHVSEDRGNDIPPEHSEVPDDSGDVGLGTPLAGAGLVGGTGAQGVGAAPAIGGGLLNANQDEDRLGRLGDAAEPFRLAIQDGGRYILLETSQVDEAVSALQKAGAQELYDPREKGNGS